MGLHESIITPTMCPASNAGDMIAAAIRKMDAADHDETHGEYFAHHDAVDALAAAASYSEVRSPKGAFVQAALALGALSLLTGSEWSEAERRALTGRIERSLDRVAAYLERQAGVDRADMRFDYFTG